MNSALPKHEITTAKGTSAVVINGDSHTQRPLIYRAIADYDLVVTSPPWIGYNNECNGVGGVDMDQWRDINEAIADFCFNAKGIEGVRGLIEVPGHLTAEETKVVEQSMRAKGLQVTRYRFEAYRYASRSTTMHQWWVIAAKNLIAHLDSLNRKAAAVTPVLQKQGSPAKVLSSLAEWKKGTADKLGVPQVPTPPAQFVSTHLEALLKAYAFEGATVLDPYVGTGTCIHYCAKHEINAIGVELYPAYYAGLQRRLDSMGAEKTIYTRGTRRHAYELLRTQAEIDELDLVDKETFTSAYASSLTQAQQQRKLREHLVNGYRSKLSNSVGAPKNLYRKPQEQGA